MTDYTDHSQVLALLEKDQDADHDNRERARAARLFLNAKNGQWEPEWWSQCAGKPRYQFDLCRPIVKQILGDIRRNDFGIDVTPEDGEASKEVAETLSGLVRNIEAKSKAREIYDLSGKLMVASGVDGWRVVTRYEDDDSFDQDLFIEPIPNFLDRAWLDSTASRQDGSDARHGFVMQAYSPSEYERRWPKGQAQSVGSDRTTNAYFHKPDVVIVGQVYYVQERERELVLMDNGRVYEVDDDFEAAVDELAAMGVFESKRRKRMKRTVYVRTFDVGGWLDEAQETVFGFIPIIPVYANFEVYENKVLYQGAVEPLMDEQRVFNYAKSREIEEVAFAPRAKYWATPEQVKGHEKRLATLNTNADPVQLYNPDPQAGGGPPPYLGGAQVNPGLANLSTSMIDLVSKTAGMFDASMGDNPGLQSGVAIERLQDRGDNGSIEYIKALEIAVGHTGRILVDAIPRLYTERRKSRVLKEDGEFDFVTLNDTVLDHQTGQEVTLNDLSQGRYMISCHAGPAFKSRQQRTVAAITEAAQVAPELLQMGGDIFARSVNAPGMELLADRIRAVNLQKGIIPFDQMTDEEKQAAIQAAQQPPEPDPAMVLAQAEQGKAQAMMLKEQNAAEREAVKLQMEQFEFMRRQQEAQAEQMRELVEQNKIIADTMKSIREAVGAQAIVSPSAAQAFEQQANKLVSQ